MNARYPLPALLSELFPGGNAGDRAWTVQLPPGRIMTATEETAQPPAYWLSDDAAPDELWSQIRAEHAASGLWPALMVILAGLAIVT